MTLWESHAWAAWRIFRRDGVTMMMSLLSTHYQLFREPIRVARTRRQANEFYADALISHCQQQARRICSSCEITISASSIMIISSPHRVYLWCAASFTQRRPHFHHFGIIWFRTRIKMTPAMWNDWGADLSSDTADDTTKMADQATVKRAARHI